MRHSPSRWLASCAVALALKAGAAPIEYSTEHGWGAMTLDRTSRTFSIESMGANGHFCAVRGSLAGTDLTYGQAENCRIHFTEASNGTVKVEADPATEESCREFCGMQVSFDGAYLPLPAECRPAALRQRQERGLVDYRAKRFDVALQTWSNGLTNCQRLMSMFDVWRWRNDMALAAHRLGRRPDCERWSQAVLDDAEPISFGTADALTAEPLLKAARHNLAQCQHPR